MLHGFDRGVIAGIVLLAAMIMGIAATSFLNTRRLRDDAGKATQSREFLDRIGAIRTDVRKLQATQRAYLISGIEDWLRPYEETTASLQSEAKALRTLTGDDGEQSRRAEAVAREIEGGIVSLNEVVALRRKEGYEGVLALSRKRGIRSFVDPLLETLAEMDRVERERLADRDADARLAYDRAVVYEFAATALGLVALALFVSLLARSVRARSRGAARLAEQRELLAATLTSIGDAVVATDVEGKITFLNAVAERLTGWSQADARGLPLDRVFRIVNESTRAPVENPAIRALREGVVVGLANHTILIARDGSEHPIDDSASPIRSRGKVGGAVLVFRDISDRKRSEAALRAGEQRYRMLFETMGEGFCLVEMLHDAEGRPVDYRLLEVNPAFEAHTGLADAAGHTIRELVPDHDAHWIEVYGRIAATGEPVRFVNEARAMGRWYDVYAYRAGGADDRRVAVLFRDITQQKRADDELARVTAESERLRREYDTALSNTADFVYLFDLTGRFTYVNKALLDLWQKDALQAVGKNFYELDYPPNLADRLQRQIQEVIRTRKPLRDETPYTSAVGTRAYEYIFVPVLGAGGEVEAVAGSTRDVTDRKRAEASLRASEERYRVLVTATSDVVYRMSPDWSEMHPLDGRDLVASNADAIRDWMEANLPPSEHARVRQAIDRAVSNKQPFDLEHQVIRADGTLGWALSRAAPILDAAAGIVEWFGTARDVTEQKQAQEGLARVTAESERRKRLYEAFLSSTPDLAYVFSLDHRFTYANEALLRMWGKTWDEAIGRTCLELGYEPWHAAMHDREIEQVKATKRRIRGEVPFSGTFGRRIYEYIFVPVLGTDGEVEAVAGTTRDVTERTEMEEALKESDRRKDDFIALLAHELRNPLAPIRNGLQVLRLADDKEARARAREMMDRQLTHMVRLIDDLLDVSRISRNKMELRRSRVTLAEVVASAVETAGPAVEAGGHELTVSLPVVTVYLDADLTRLAQVFSNLLTNSAKYTGRCGRIGLSAEWCGAEVTVAVRDDGIGIPAESLPTIFDMFSQVDRSVERSTGGLGIGLALVRGLVEMHGGTVAVRSDGEGKGSTFTVTLPVAAAPTGLGIDSSEGPFDPGLKRRILVVDDNRDGAESLAMMLGLMDNQVRTANDGLEAVEQAERFRPEVILMDVGMPRLNGLEATKRIREQEWGKTMTIIALTGWGQDGDRERSREAGCDGHLVKPVHLPDLQKLLEQLGR